MKLLLKFSNLVLFLSGSLFFSCNKVEEKKDVLNSPTYIELTDDQFTLMDIAQAPIENKSIHPIVMANGRIGVNNNFEAKMSTNVSGRIERLFVQEGSLVQKGDPVLTISSLEFVQLQQDYMKAYSEAMYLEKEYNRQLELRSADVASVADFQSIEAKYYSALATEKAYKAKLAVLRKDATELQDPKYAKISLEKMIYSPISGYVYKMPAKIGMRANPEMTLVDIVDLNELRAEVFLYEKDLDKIEEGGEVEIRFINKNIPAVHGTIKFINRSIDDLNKTVMLIVSFEKPKNALILPEMFINARVKGKSKSAIKQSVPVTALFEEGNQQSIFTILPFEGKNVIKKIKVKLGEMDDEYAQIIPEVPLDEGCKVAVKNLLVLDAELKKMGVQ